MLASCTCREEYCLPPEASRCGSPQHQRVVRGGTAGGASAAQRTDSRRGSSSSVKASDAAARSACEAVEGSPKDEREAAEEGFKSEEREAVQKEEVPALGAEEGRKVSKWKSRWGMAAPQAPKPVEEGGFSAAATAGAQVVDAAFPFKKSFAVGSATVSGGEASGLAADSSRAAEKYLGSLEAKPKIKIVLSRSAQQQQPRHLRDPELPPPLPAETEKKSLVGRPPGGVDLGEEAVEEESEDAPDGALARGGARDGVAAAEASEGRDSEIEDDADALPTWRRPKPPSIPVADRDASPARSSGSSRGSPAVPLALALEAHRLNEGKSGGGAGIAAAAADSLDEGSEGSRSGGCNSGGNMFKRRRIGKDGLLAPRKQVSEEETAAPSQQQKGGRWRRSRSRSRSRSSSGQNSHRSLSPRGPRRRRRSSSREGFRGRPDSRRSPPSHPARGYRGDSRERGRGGYYQQQHHRAAPRSRGGGDHWRGEKEWPWRDSSRRFDDRRDGGRSWRRCEDEDLGMDYGEGRRSLNSGERGYRGFRRYDEARPPYREARDSRMQRRQRSRSSEGVAYKRGQGSRESLPREDSASRRHVVRERSCTPPPPSAAEEQQQPPPSAEKKGLLEGGRARRVSSSCRDDDDDANPSARRRRSERSHSPGEQRKRPHPPPDETSGSPRRSRLSPEPPHSRSRDGIKERTQEGHLAKPRCASPPSRHDREASVSPGRRCLLSDEFVASASRRSSETRRYCKLPPRESEGSPGAVQRSPTPNDRRRDARAAERRERRDRKRRSRSVSSSERRPAGVKRPPRGSVSPPRSLSQKHGVSRSGERGVQRARQEIPPRGQSSRLRGPSPAPPLRRRTFSRERRASVTRKRHRSRSSSIAEKRSASRSVSRRSVDVAAEGASEKHAQGRHLVQRHSKSPEPLRSHSPEGGLRGKASYRESPYKRSRYAPSGSPPGARPVRRSREADRRREAYGRRLGDDTDYGYAKDRGYRGGSGRPRGRYRDPSRARSSRSASWGRRSWERHRGY
ncbi:hypothetical protein cyc_08791 [Cyclospora cayetanensis]|uniref:Uncharacterized protein n=1 Tax=Cyclospora cayetanensis TaxID=88456 RepID=A0A1D3D1E0_9EIME|nr:hypothetical protein cyc_08791 [Cyclospora cayetanensis]